MAVGAFRVAAVLISVFSMYLSSVDASELLHLRREVLGWPEVLVPGDDAEDTLRITARDEDGETVGVVLLVPHRYPHMPTDPAIYFWGMAVRRDRQLRGAGSLLLAYVLNRGLSGGAYFVWADARQSAVPFYQRLGGTPVGAAYTDTITGLSVRRILFDLRR